MIKGANYSKLIYGAILITVLFIVVYALAFRYFYGKIEEIRVSEYEKYQNLIASQTTSLLKDFIEHIKLELESFSLSSPKEGSIPNKEIFRKYHSGLVESILFISKLNGNGEISENPETPFLKAFTNYSSLDFFSVPKLTKEPYISEVYDNSKNRRILIISVPLYREVSYISLNNTFDGVLIAAVDLNRLSELYLEQLKLGINGYVWAVRTDGKLLSPPKELWKNVTQESDYFSWVKNNYPENSNNINKMIVESEGSFIDSWGKNGKTVTSYSHVVFGASAWIIAVTTPYSELSQSIKPIQERMYYFFISTILIVSISVITTLVILKSKQKTEKQLLQAEITLEKLGIKAISEVLGENGIKIELKERNIYLVKEKYERNSYNIFISLLNKHYAGLVLTRSNIEETKRLYGLEKTPILWLGDDSKRRGKTSVLDLTQLKNIIGQFAEESQKTVVLIDRTDYLISQYGFEATLTALHSLRDVIVNSSNEPILLFSLNPHTLSDSQLNLLEEECQDITNLISKEKPKLPKDLFELLEYVNTQSLQNKKIFFKNVSREFNITRPTTKKKIDMLLHYGFIEVEEHGRVKSLTISDKGAKFLENK